MFHKCVIIWYFMDF